MKYSNITLNGFVYNIYKYNMNFNCKCFEQFSNNVVRSNGPDNWCLF
jgi:hypothetical protein